MFDLLNSTRGHSMQVLALASVTLLMSACSPMMMTTRGAVDATKAGVKGTTHASRATTNASVTEPDSPRYAEAEKFVRSQRQQLAQQAAQGGGEDIDALSSLLGKQDSQAVGRWMQSNYQSLFSDQSVSASKIVTTIDAQTT